MSRIPSRREKPVTLDRWVATDVEFAERLAIDPTNGLPLWMRVWFLGVQRVNRIGHAEFGVGELARLLKAPSNRVSEAIARLREIGYIATDSHARCLVIPRGLMQQARPGSTASCGFHGID